MSRVRPLSADLQRVAIEELNEVPERLDADIVSLRTWVQQQPHLTARTDDQFLVAFLRGCKFSLERAKSKLDMYYTLRTKFPQFFTVQNVDDPRVLELLRLGVAVYLPTPLFDNGPRILFVRSGIYPVDKFTFADVLALSQGVQAITLTTDDYAVVNGVIMVSDMAAMSAGHIMQMTPTLAKTMSLFSEKALPLRQKGSHIINTPKGFEPIYNAFKPLMPAKQQERMYVHGDKMDSLYQHIPKKYLPVEYGGENGSIQQQIDVAVESFLRYCDFLIEENKFGVNEKLRTGKAIEYNTIFGVDGSFRQLNVD